MTHDAAPAPPRANANAPSTRWVECLALPPEPWANGNGTTRTIARGGDAGWRVSVATLNAAARFSSFAGFDRTLLPLDVDAVELHSPHGPLIARRGEPARFPGELAVWSAPPAGCVNVLNVMTRRDSYESSVGVVGNASRIVSARIHLLIGLAGKWRVHGACLDGMLVGPLQAWLIDGPRIPLELVPVDIGASQLVSIAIEPRSS